MTVDSLWGEEFTIKEDTEAIINKAKKPKEVKSVSTEKLIKSKNVSIEDKMEAIKNEVYRILGQYADDTQVIKDIYSFKAYIDSAIKNGIIAIDTETNNSLNTFDCKIMGLCLYTPGQKNTYVPVNHINFVTGERLKWQITEEQIREQLQRLVDSETFMIFHNATFDIEVIKTTCGIKLKADWDTMVGAQLLNENEHKSLKEQYKIHINPDQDKYSIEKLFQGLPYELFDTGLFALYAATDSFMTYKLYEYQRNEFRKPDMKDVYNLFQTIEIPIIDVIVDMELTGVEIDVDYAKRMSTEYHKRSDEVQTRIDKELEHLKPLIDSWRLTPEANAHPVSKSKSGYGKSKNEQLANPIDLGSPTQLAILLYDILKAPIVDKTAPRGTGAEILDELKEKYDICKLIVEKRGVDILINTFIDKMPEIIQKDGRVHARFNQCGTQTGRFSSSDPNLQNIPSHDKTIRMMFKAPKGMSIVGGDFSGQEVRVLASAANDKEMIKAYAAGKDLYAQIASLAFHNEYEDNLEFDPRNGGQLNPEGKARRSRAKTLLLGLNYGMGITTLAERIGSTTKEAQYITDEFYKGFTGVKKYTEESQQMLREKGYITDLWGRRRHISDGMLPEYEFNTIGVDYDFNPLMDSVKHVDSRTQALISDYKKKLANIKWNKERTAIIEQAKQDGIYIKSNGGYINRALRQCLNARIQGSSATMTKLAMIMIHNNKELNDLGFQLLITVHDEILGQCPTENSERVAELVAQLMVEAAKSKCGNVAWKVDCYQLKRWYADESAAEVLKDYNKIKDQPNALKKIQDKYCMIKPEYVEMMCNETYDCNKYEDI